MADDDDFGSLSSLEDDMEDEQTEQGGFLRVSQKRLSDSSPDSSSEDDRKRRCDPLALNWQITGAESPLKLNPVQFSNGLYRAVGAVASISRCVGGYVVKCADQNQARGIQRLRELPGLGILVKTEVHRPPPKFIQGIIRGVDIDLTGEELSAALGAQVAKSRRLGKTTSVLLHFSGTELPPNVKLGYMTFSVSEFVNGPVRCFKCQEFGHIGSSCRGNIRCVRCGGGHAVVNCSVQDKPVCFRCNGEHSAAWGQCPKVLEAKEVASVQRSRGVSYSQALRHVRGCQGSGQVSTRAVREDDASRPSPAQSAALAPSAAVDGSSVVRSESEASLSPVVTVPVRSLVIFSAALLSRTLLDMDKSKRVRMICDLAEAHLKYLVPYADVVAALRASASSQARS